VSLPPASPTHGTPAVEAWHEVAGLEPSLMRRKSVLKALATYGMTYSQPGELRELDANPARHGPTLRQSALRRALTTAEILLVLSVLAAVISASVWLLRGSTAHRDAASLARTLTSARWIAVATGMPTMLVSRDQAIYLGRGEPLNCDREPTGAPVWEPSRPVAWRWPAMDLAFGAHGRPLRCDGSAVGNTTITLNGRDGSSAAVVIASLGRIRWERR